MQPKRLTVSLALGMLLIGAAAARAQDTPGPPSTDGIQPVLVLGNPPCANLPGADSDWIELRINAPADGTYGDGALSVTLDTQNGPDGPHFSWTSNLGVDAVFVKGGSNGNLYTYDPPTEDTGDGFLHSPINPQNDKFYGLSHLLFCYDIEPPAVEVVKGGDPLSKIGDPVTYTFDVTNTGGTPLALVSVTDTLLGDLTAQAAAGGCDPLAIGATCHFEVVRVVQQGDPDPLPNTVTVVYHPTIGTADDVSDSDDHEVNLFQPAIEFDKVADTDLSKIGDDVTYTLTLHNTSSADSPDLVCTIDDVPIGFSKSVTLASGESDVSTVPFTIPSGASDPFVNDARVSCSPEGFPNVLEASDSVSINLFQPSVALEKTGPDYSKVGDTNTYTVKITNTSSSDSPDLELASFSDSLVPSATPPTDCQTLAPGAFCEFSYDYVVQPGDDSGEPGATLSNTASVLYHPAGFPNDITAEDTWELTLLHPDYTLSKDCAEEPVPQEGPAVFDIVFENTGDVDLEVVANEDLACDGTDIPAGSEFTLAEGETKSCTHEIDGPFTGTETVTNTIDASAILPDEFDLPNVLDRTASAECGVGGRVEVEKTTAGVVDPSLELVFGIYDGPNEGGPSDFLATPLVTDSTSGDADGVLTFELSGFPINLDPQATYTLCELELPSGWTSEWTVDSDGDHVPDTVIVPYDPNANDDPPEDHGNRCADFGAGTSWPVPAGDKLVFAVNNVPPPGGDARTPGYWKNWNRCTGGGQADNADRNGGPAAGFFLLEDVLPFVWDDILVDGFEFHIDSCAIGVDLLDRRDIGDPDVVKDGKKRANDAAYSLASHLLAAQANFAAGAAACQEALDAAAAGEELLDEIDFDGTGKFLPPRGGNQGPREQAILLAATLDMYNNNELCGP